MNAAIAYEGTGGPYGSPNGLVMIDKILSIAERADYDHRVIRLSDGSSIATRTTLVEFNRRIGEALLAANQQPVTNIAALPEPVEGQTIRSGDKPRRLPEPREGHPLQKGEDP